MMRVTKMMLDAKIENLNNKTGKNYKLQYENNSVRLCRVCNGYGGLEAVSPFTDKKGINDILETLCTFLHV
jgi:hypothetical protein